MSEPNLPPLPPETVDELLSAALDGELVAAAADLGVDPRHARTVVEQHHERYARLAAARDAVAREAPVDELTRRRLVAAATAAAGVGPRPARAARGRRAFGLSGAAAAALVALLLGIGSLTVVGIASWTSSDGADDAAGGDDRGGSGSSTAAESAGLADLGEVGDAEELRRRVSEQIDPRATPQLMADAPDADTRRHAGAQEEAVGDGGGDDAVAAPASTTTAAARTTAGSAGEAVESPTAAGATHAVGDPVACHERVAGDLQITAGPLLLATAEYGGRPSGVSVFEVRGRVVAVVYALDDCTLLASQSWTAG